ncbi:hypothetical protein P9112_006725 [Eukaryota sp. TZLM1-RC]
MHDHFTRFSPHYTTSTNGSKLYVIPGDNNTIAVDDNLDPLHSTPIHHNSCTHIFLGNHNTRSIFLISSDQPSSLPLHFESLRSLQESQSTEVSSILSLANSLHHFHVSHKFCGICGSRTELSSSGWSRKCPHHPKNEIFPRQDPCVITLVRNITSTHVLLARNSKWKLPRYSTIAGFIDIGEVPEDAVRREVKEEVGVTVDEIEYISSQFWPFPRSLMLGFFCVGDDDQPIELVDGEIQHARWFSRDEVERMVDAGKEEDHVPGVDTIAGTLIRKWVFG